MAGCARKRCRSTNRRRSSSSCWRSTMANERRSAAEQPPAWFKSSYSGDGGGNCVEVARADSTVHIRDSKVVGGPLLNVSRAGWSSFVASLMR
ncbi:DUF397 domain-containing protein [Streptomyces sp. NHF165]|uniref:DUF397 domain-containing protein n=1 Tax=Streptomyces sp. NHF165 TaxID=2175864 RepID=UPI002E2CCB94|nr:DUF397 domain-containing protein [Streptomyces sp. NHF165]